MATLQEQEAELQRLRTANAELTAKASTRKERIAELDAELANIKSKLAEQAASHEAEKTQTQAFIHKHFVDSVAIELAADMSTAPDLMLPFISSRLSVDTTDGQAPKTVVLDINGKPSKLTLADLRQELSKRKDLAPIIIASRASGGGATGSGRSSATPPKEKKQEPTKPALHFGLK